MLNSRHQERDSNACLLVDNKEVKSDLSLAMISRSIFATWAILREIAADIHMFTISFMPAVLCAWFWQSKKVKFFCITSCSRPIHAFYGEIDDVLLQYITHISLEVMAAIFSTAGFMVPPLSKMAPIDVIRSRFISGVTHFEWQTQCA